MRKRYALSLEAADAQRIEREVALKRKELTAAYRREAEELAKRLNDEEDGNRRYIAVQIQNLGYYEVIYKTAIEQQGGVAKDQRHAKLERVRSQLRRLRGLLEAPKPDMNAMAEARLKSRLEDVDLQTKRFRAELTQKAQEEFIRAVTQAGVDIKAELQAISPLKTAVARREPLRAFGVVPAPSQEPLRQSARANRKFAEDAYTQMEAKIKKSREERVRADVRIAVDALFAKKGWRRVEPGSKGATDATEEIDRLLQAEGGSGLQR